MKVEFFIDPVNTKHTIIHDTERHTYREFTQADKELVFRVMRKLEYDYPECFELLKDLYDSDYKSVNRFLRCNFAVHDFKADIDDDTNFEFENVPCPLKGGLCKHECIICNPKMKEVISEREIQVAEHLVKGLPIEKISELLFISEDTVKNHRKNIYHKLDIHCIQELGLIAYRKGWVQ